MGFSRIPIWPMIKKNRKSKKEGMSNLQEERQAAWSESRFLGFGKRRCEGTGTEAIMYLYIKACLSSSFHCAIVKGNPIDDAIIPEIYTYQQYLQSVHFLFLLLLRTNLICFLT